MRKLIGSVSWPIWALFIASSLFFVAYPQIDLTVTGWFYNEAEGFYLRDTWWVYLLYHSVKYVVILSSVGALAWWLYNRYAAKKVGRFGGKQAGYLLLVLALGPGLIVNWVLKENWGRARPHETTYFGGSKTFVPAYVVSDQCTTNCSFSSGHAAGAFFTVALAMLATRRRPFWLTLAIVYGSAVGLARIVVGGHFFSDVVVSFFIVYIVSRMLHERMFGDESAEKKVD